jgi:hypothetical protein
VARILDKSGMEVPMSFQDRKPWYVFDQFGRFLGTVWAERKYQAMFLAERELKARPGFYVGKA